MEYILSEESEIKISRIIFGTWAIGGWYFGKSDDRISLRSIHAALDSGIQTFDTAPVYGLGHSENLLGKALKNNSSAVIATKCGLRFDDEKREGMHFFDIHDYEIPVHVYRNLRYSSIIHECEESLKRLGRDWIDIYQIHWPDRSVAQEETAEALNELYEKGKIRSTGVCNYTVQKLIELKKLLKVPLISDQEKLSLIHRKSLSENIPYAVKNKVIFFAYGALAQGLLTNTVQSGRIFPDEDYRNKSEIMQESFRESVSKIFQGLESLRQKYNCSFANIASAWALQVSGPNSCVISGIRNENQALENSRACDIRLNGNEVRTLSDTFSSIVYRGKW